MKQTFKAKKIWDALPNQMRIKILNNVYCVNCKGMVSIATEKMNIKEMNLIIRGNCTSCNHEVCRVVESDFFTSTNQS